MSEQRENDKLASVTDLRAARETRDRRAQTSVEGEQADSGDVSAEVDADVSDAANADVSEAVALADVGAVSAAAESPPVASQPAVVPEPQPNPVSEQAAAHDGYHVSLPMFEGPLDLLLHLIQKHDVDVLDIPISFITEKYLHYLKVMEDLSIDVASEYLVMAATLIHIKSKMLLPPSPDQDEDEDVEPDEDPRAELVRRLLEYQKYKDAAAQLGSRHVLGRDVFGRGLDVEQTTGPAPLAQVSLFKLLDAFQGILEKSKQLQDHEINFERITITERISQLSDVLRNRGEVPFEELFTDDRSKGDLIVTFLALLEMTRLRLTELIQNEPLDPIVVCLRVRDDELLEDELAELDAPGASWGPNSADDSDDSDDDDEQSDLDSIDGEEE